MFAPLVMARKKPSTNPSNGRTLARAFVQYKPESAAQIAQAKKPAASWDFSETLVFSPGRADRSQPPTSLIPTRLPDGVQAKLVVGRVDDPLEDEADRMAEQVIHAADADFPMTSAPPYLDRKSVAREDEVRRDSNLSSVLDGQEAPPDVHTVLAEPGRPFDVKSRAYFEPRFGADFSSVRIHTDALAAGTSKAMNARAFTVGRHIVFGANQYAPESRAGKRLLAHELTHVVQQENTTRSVGRMGRSRLTPARERVQRWEGLEHKKVGNRAQNEFPYRGTIPTDMTALRASPAKNPKSPHENTAADLLSGAKVLVLGQERGWLQVVVESGTARDKKGVVVPASSLTGYVSHELVTKSAGVFDAELPVGGDLVLSYGDLVAFGGDHFADYAQLSGEASSPSGRGRLKRLRDLTDSEATQSPAYEDEKTISREYAERYKNLALENVSHFSGGGAALITWQRLHRNLVLAALDAGEKGDSGRLAETYAANAFADHFLTDSFSSGHVRTPREQAIIYYKKLAHDAFQHIIDEVSTRLGSRIYELLRQDYRRVRAFGDEGDRQHAIASVRAQVMDGIAHAGGPARVQEQFGLYVAGAFSKIMHDQDNAHGLDVVSQKHPEGWTAFGDGKLDTTANAKNLAYMIEAVQASKEDLLDAFKIGVDLVAKHGKTPPQAAIDAAMVELTKKVGPPYAALGFVPSPAPGAKPLPAWEWGKLDQPMKTELVGMIARYLTTTAQEELLRQFPLRQEVEVRGPNVDARPRDAARDVLNEFLADPVRFLEQAFGRSAGP